MSALWVVVPAHQEAERIDATLDALAAQRDRDFTLVVVDNASTDGTARDRPRLRPLGALPGPRPQRAGEGGGLRCGHRLPVRDRARGDAAGPHRRRLPAAPRPDGRCPRRPAARRGPGVRTRRRAPRRARSAGTGPPSAPWSARPRASGGYARPTTAATATSPRTGCTPATTWPSPPRGTKPSAACPAAPPPPTRPSTGNGPWRADGMAGAGRSARPRSAA
ncbi:glycosyltransferase family 2 protein [Streptomyces achromogenes]|uniref:glycosyltransferase family 2 protein n=1 Tax=Streptomyces achromogenes TaxID=67255 RepID=UPI0033E24625